MVNTHAEGVALRPTAIKNEEEMETELGFEEIKEMMNRLLDSLGDVSDGDGLVEFMAYAKSNGGNYSEQTLRNYRSGTYSKDKEFTVGAYLRKYNELARFVEEYVRHKRSGDRYTLLLGTVWNVYFLNWSKFKDSYSLGRAVISFQSYKRVELKNLPDKAENPDKEGFCTISGTAAFVNLSNIDIPESYLNIMLDISGDVANSQVMIGAYQAREKNLVMVGTLLFHRVDGRDVVEKPPMALSLAENRAEFLHHTDRTIREFISRKSQNLLKIFPNPSGSMDSLGIRMDHYRKKKQSRLVTTFVEPGYPKVFISVPRGGDELRQEETGQKIQGLIEGLEKRFDGTDDKGIEVVYLQDKDDPGYEYTSNMNHVKSASVFVFIYPYEKGEQVLSTAFVELGWAFLSSLCILSYAHPGVLPERLENYLKYGAEDIAHSGHVDYDQIQKDITYRIEKIYST